MAQAAEAVKDKDFTNAVPEARHVHVGAGLAGVRRCWHWRRSRLCVPEAAWNALQRWAMPWREHRALHLCEDRSAAGRLVVPYAEPFDLKVQLDKDTRWSPQARRRRRSVISRLQSTLKDGAYPLAFPPQKDDAEP
jgi:hypothetical protein